MDFITKQNRQSRFDDQGNQGGVGGGGNGGNNNGPRGVNRQWNQNNDRRNDDFQNKRRRF